MTYDAGAVSIQQLSKSYPTQYHEDLTVLEDINLEIKSGEFIKYQLKSKHVFITKTL